MNTLQRRIGPWIVAAALLGMGSAMAQSSGEPSLAQVYEAAQAGQLDKAQVMMQQVLVVHPNSAKAHLVQAELSARQGNFARAQEELQTAERLAPGLPFAKPEAVQHLRSQMAGRAPAGTGAATSALTTTDHAVARGTVPTPAAPVRSFPWGLVLGVGVAAIALFALFRRKQAANATAAGGYGGGIGGGGLRGPQGFGTGNAAPPYAQPGQPGYGQGPTAGPGMGSRIAGGLATGLAVGAGMMAANAIGKTIMGDDDDRHGHGNRHGDDASNSDAYRYDTSSSSVNADMGGQNFGVQDGGGWDDAGGGGSLDAGGDWDN